MMTLRYRQNPTNGNLHHDPFVQMVNRFITDLAPTAAAEQTRGFKPPVDIVEQDNAFLATVDLPGIKKEDIEISLEEGVLTIAGERKPEHQAGGEGTSFRLVERTYGTFSRSFTLPQGVDVTQVEAHFTDGVLKLTLPKSEAAKPHKISIA